MVFHLLQASGRRGRNGAPGGERDKDAEDAEEEEDVEEEVEWVNEGEETGLPYDIIIRRHRRSPSGGGPAAGGGGGEEDGPEDPISFIEVKSTRDRLGPDSGGTQPFALSVKELLFALHHGPRYQVTVLPRPPSPSLSLPACLPPSRSFHLLQPPTHTFSL